MEVRRLVERRIKGRVPGCGLGRGGFASYGRDAQWTDAAAPRIEKLVIRSYECFCKCQNVSQTNTTMRYNTMK
ncbi:unnamed protein product [Trichogramma brassicae]|uniref:Uncharacterized protein n=1 Tax=Trichogramma brassicae TaxID=86971 RepID=A0A6H5I5S0_9HYME|nr:unnamed protein product [Trichogramma brassicae]